MEDADDPIPVDCIRLSKAFNEFYRGITPGWRELDDEVEYAERCMNSLDYDCDPGPIDRAYEQWDDARNEARGEAEEVFRSQLVIGTAIAFIRDPVSRECLQLRPESWGMPGGYDARGILQDFTAPNDSLCPGPKTLVNGRRRPVFFKLSEFEKLLARVKPSAETPADVAAKQPTNVIADSPVHVVVEVPPTVDDQQTVNVAAKQSGNDDVEPPPALIRSFPDKDPLGPKKVVAVLKAMQSCTEWREIGGVPATLSVRKVWEVIKPKLKARGSEPVSEDTVWRAMAILGPIK